MPNPRPPRQRGKRAEIIGPKRPSAGVIAAFDAERRKWDQESLDELLTEAGFPTPDEQAAQDARRQELLSHKAELEAIVHQRHVERMAKYGWKLWQDIPATDPNVGRWGTLQCELRLDEKLIERLLGPTARILAICDRLDGAFGDPAEKLKSPIIRHVDKNVTYPDYTSDAELWQERLDTIRAWAGGGLKFRGGKSGWATADEAASWMLHSLGGIPKPAGKRMKARYNKLASDVSDLCQLVESQCPRECALCGKTFACSEREQGTCDDCRRLFGQLREVWIALASWWKGKTNRPLNELANRTDWADFRQAFFRRFNMMLGDNGLDWDSADVRRQQEAWARFDLFMRERKPADASEQAWRNIVLNQTIADATTLLQSPANAGAGYHNAGSSEAASAEAKAAGAQPPLAASTAPIPVDDLDETASDEAAEHRKSRRPPPTEDERRRPTYKRNLLWLKWAEEVGLDEDKVYCRVRDRWNELSDSQRQTYAPYHKPLPKGKAGWDRVRKGIEAAQKDKKPESES